MNTSWAGFSLKCRVVAIFLLVLGTFPVSADFTLQLTPQFYPSFAPPAGGGGDAGMPVISADGRYVLFASTANNLVLTTGNSPIPCLTPASLNVYLRDMASNTTTLASVNLAGNGGGNGDSLPVAISTNGQYVLFESAASDLVAGDANNAGDVFVRDLVNGTTFLVSVNTNGVSGNGVSRNSVMTPDGRCVAFVSAANDLVANDTNQIPDIFVRDLLSGTTTLISVGAMATSSSLPAGSSESPAISDNGQFVAFYSTATNLISGLQATGQIYVRDLISGITSWASTNAPAMAYSVIGSSNVISCSLVLSADGNYIAFEVVTNSLTAYSTGGIILRQNVQTGAADLVCTNANVTSGSFETIRSLDMTPDGRFIAFVGNVTGNSPVTNTAIYLWDAQAGTNALVSADRNSGLPGNGICNSPVVSSNGQYIAFVSNGTNLTTNALMNEFHLYLRDAQAGTTWLLDADPNGIGVGVDAMLFPTVSADGQLVAFESFQGNLSPGDRNQNDDVFVFHLDTNWIELASLNDPAFPGSGPTISWPTNSAQTYQVQFKNNLSEDVWQDAVGSITIMGNHGYFTDLVPASTQKFYRAVTY